MEQKGLSPAPHQPSFNGKAAISQSVYAVKGKVSPGCSAQRRNNKRGPATQVNASVMPEHFHSCLTFF